MSPESVTTISFDELIDYSSALLMAAGASPGDARDTSRLLAQTDAFGIHSHGLKNLSGYLEKARHGALDLTASPSVVREGDAFVLLNGHNGIGMIAGTRAMGLAIEKAKRIGIAIVSVRNSTHCGATGLYALPAAEQGLIGIVVSNVDPNMTVPGARGKVLGNNPLAYSLPGGRHRPVIFDIALSTVASLKVVKARARGESIPEGWIVDGAGRTTTDPSHYPEVGAMLPMAGHKGYGLALLVDALTGSLADAPTSDLVPSWLFDMDRPNQVTHTFIVINPASFDPSGGYEARIEAFLDRIHGTPLADGASEVLHPGQLEWRQYDRAVANGVELPEDVRETLDAAGAFYGIRSPWSRD